MKFAITLAVALGFATPAFAKHHRPFHHRHHARHHSIGAHSAHGSRTISGRPHAWCGWYMRKVLGVADAAYNLAANWAHYGSSCGGPAVGCVVVWPHHVGIIRGRGNRGWIIESGNDGHRIRTRERSIAGAIAFRRTS